MRIQCQHCQASYVIEEAIIPEGGGSATCKQCGAKILIQKPASFEAKPAACPKCGRPVREGATDCTACGVVLAKYQTPAGREDELFEREERFRMSELTETDDEPEPFSSGIGIKVQEARKVPKWLLGGLLILMVLLAFFQFGGQRRWFGLFGGPVVTMAQYQEVQSGMSYRQVADMVGEPGEQTGSSRIEDVPGVTTRVETVSYQWVNPDGSQMTAVFQNDRLITKTQINLR